MNDNAKRLKERLNTLDIGEYVCWGTHTAGINYTKINDDTFETQIIYRYGKAEPSKIQKLDELLQVYN